MQDCFVPVFLEQKFIKLEGNCQETPGPWAIQRDNLTHPPSFYLLTKMIEIDRNCIYIYLYIYIESLYGFTGSGWGLWFSSRKCRLYKLGTQENLATDIKPIWGILEKWQLTRSAFSKLCLAFFLRKTSPYLNCIVLKTHFENAFLP